MSPCEFLAKRWRGLTFDRERLHLESAFEAVNPSCQIRQNLPNRFQVTVRRIHGES